MSPYADGLGARIRGILAGSDLSTVSAKAVRKQLVVDGEDAEKVKEHRGDIDAMIAEIYDELAAVDAEESSDDEPLNNTATKDTDTKPAVKRETALPNQIESDAAMAKQMQAELDASSRGRERRTAAAPVKKKSKTTPKKKKKRSNSDVDDSDAEDKPKKKKGGGGAFNKELILSDSLSAFLNEARLSRPQTVKRIWDYVKANGLQDQSDKRYILCDDAMQTVFHTEKLHMFTMNKILAQHFRDPDAVV